MIDTLFPTLRKNTPRPDRLDAALDNLFDGVQAGEIRNVVLKDVKFLLSNEVRRAWQNDIQDRFFFGQEEEPDKALLDLHFNINMSNLHDVFASHKKLTKTKLEGPEVEAMRAFCDEMLPLAEAVAGLKTKVIKGRLPTTKASQPENPNKVVKTCPVCFRKIAVQQGTMSHHGYQRPGDGMQTDSCPGVRFRPLEVSSEGLEWLINDQRQRVNKLKDDLAHQDTRPAELMERTRLRGPVERIGRDHPMWPRVFARYLANLEGNIWMIENNLPKLDDKLANWKPE